MNVDWVQFVLVCVVWFLLLAVPVAIARLWFLMWRECH